MHVVTFPFKVLLLLALLPTGLHADDGAASIAVGGLVAMKREPRIAMAKEVLRISATKVIVDYDFRNDSDEDITTTVAFPIPDYEMGEEYASKQGFDDFRLWIDGVATQYEIETRAFVKDREYTMLLREMNVDIGSFGHATGYDSSPDILKLTGAQRKQLQNNGLLDKFDEGKEQVNGEPLWRVSKKYYWQQTFPARKTVHIRHEYTPVRGSSNSIKYGLLHDPSDPQSAAEIDSFCFDGHLRKTLQQVAESKDKDAPYSYVDFILTTANTWKTPIEDFMLIVERPHWKNHRGRPDLADFVSFCWDGPLNKIDTDHFSAHVENFVPSRELRIGFFGVRF